MKMLLLSLITLLFVAQSDSKLIWNESRKLTWADFRGTPDNHSPFAASTNTGIHFGYKFTNENGNITTEFSIESFFNQLESWFYPHLADEHILSHEQTHFDISELHARILRKQLAEKKFTRNAKNEIHTIYTRVEQQRSTMQKRFDSETNHSQNFKKEAWWKSHIATQLKKYDRWK